LGNNDVCGSSFAVDERPNDEKAVCLGPLCVEKMLPTEGVDKRTVASLRVFGQIWLKNFSMLDFNRAKK
jgi:hypothetical protein